MSDGGITFARIFSMPAFEGLRVLRIYADKHPKLALPELVALIVKLEPDGSAFDLEAAVKLCALIDGALPNDGIPFYRGCMAAVLVQHQPIWLRILTQGRARFLQKLGRDEYSLFRQAELLDDEPDEIVVAWWDRVSGLVRLEGDWVRQERARRAERLTIETEKKRLNEIGIALRPKWVGLDDNTAGYDVLSYEKGTPDPVNKLIEVKSTIASPLRFILTRNEWNKAKEVGAAYCFHIWDLAREPPVLYLKTVDQVAPHVPADLEKGKWKTVEIPVGI
jgi:hypothetical protein